MNICSLFLSAAEKFPDKIAIIENDKKIDFKTLALQVRETAGFLEKKGIKKGDRVLVFIPMGIDLYRTVLAIFYIGAGAVFLDEWVSKKRMELCCKIADCKAFAGIFKARLFAMFSSELRKIPIKFGTDFKYSGNLPEICPVEADTTALITFTTGSSGTPKAADRTHDFLNEQFKALLKEINPKTEDVDMTILPIVLFINLGVACTSVIPKFKQTKQDKTDANKLIEQIEKHKVNRISGSPFFIKIISEKLLETGKKLPNLKNIFTGGAAVFPKEAKLFKASFPDSHISIVYGSTEAEPISSIDISELLKKENYLNTFGLPVGTIFEDTSLKIIEFQDKKLEFSDIKELEKTEVKTGETGEIIVSGNHVLGRYFNNTEAFLRNKIKIDNKLWHRTGDSGKKDEFNNLYLTGPCKQLIKTENTGISPFVIENILLSIEGIEIGTILKSGNEIFIVIQLKPAEKPENIREKIIKTGIIHDKIIFIKKIPRDPRHNSKIDYSKLQNYVLK